jgi:5-methylcytosine-specific restriction endonuclease McrA
LQILPGDPGVDVGLQIDLLVAAGLLDRWRNPDGSQYLQVRTWSRHQKVDKPSQVRVAREGSRKLAIPQAARRELATRYGCPPGGEVEAECYYCGAVGVVHWFKRRDGSPSYWVAFSALEIDHFVSEINGGSGTAENLVLACRECNRSKADRDGETFLKTISTRAREGSRGLPALREGNGGEGKGGERNYLSNVLSNRPARAREPVLEAGPRAIGDDLGAVVAKLKARA